MLRDYAGTYGKFGYFEGVFKCVAAGAAPLLYRAWEKYQTNTEVDAAVHGALTNMCRLPWWLRRGGGGGLGGERRVLEALGENRAPFEAYVKALLTPTMNALALFPADRHTPPFAADMLKHLLSSFASATVCLNDEEEVKVVAKAGEVLEQLVVSGFTGPADVFLAKTLCTCFAALAENIRECHAELLEKGVPAKMVKLQDAFVAGDLVAKYGATVGRGFEPEIFNLAEASRRLAQAVLDAYGEGAERRLFLELVPTRDLPTRLASCHSCWTNRGAPGARACPQGPGHDTQLHCAYCQAGEGPGRWAALQKCGHVFHLRCIMEGAALATREARRLREGPPRSAAAAFLCPICRAGGILTMEWQLPTGRQAVLPLDRGGLEEVETPGDQPF